MWLVLIASVAALAFVVRRWARRGSGGSGTRGSRRGALLTVTALIGAQALLGVPAFAQPLDCTQPPNPERPGAGMVGALDPAPLGVGQSGSAYAKYGYAGMVWHTYDLGCGPQGVTNPNAVVGTWIGNQLFNVAKNLVGATNGLHYALLSGNILDPLDEVISTGTIALYDSVFAPWFGLVALVLAVILFRYIWRGDMATIGKRVMWALAGLWFASATYLTPLIYTNVLDEIVLTGTSAVQAGFLREVGVDERDALPTLLHDQIVYRNWLRGEFGSPDSPKAQQLGMDLLAAQAFSKREVLSGEAQQPGAVQEKKRKFEQVASKMGSAYGYFRGVDGSRIGAGMLAMLQAFAYTSFQLLAKAAILLAQVLLRVLILAGPLIGLVALIYHQVLRTVGRIAGAALLNVVMISAMAGIHLLVLTWIFDPARGLSVLTRMLLAALLTIVFLMIGKPVRRMGQMIELSVGAVGGTMPRVPPGVFSRARSGRRGRDGEQDSQGDFWDQVRSSDSEDEYLTPQGGQRRARPESETLSVAATAQRMDRQYPGAREPRTGGSGEGATSAESAASQDRQRPGSRQGPSALPEARSTSRTVDTSPVADFAWNEQEEDPVLIPSSTGDSTVPDPSAASTPRRPDAEVVAGRPVNVVYRPSRGLEVADG